MIDQPYTAAPDAGTRVAVYRDVIPTQARTKEEAFGECGVMGKVRRSTTPLCPATRAVSHLRMH